MKNKKVTPLKACWKGYVAKGFKKKGNKKVPNCVSAKKRV